MRPLLLLVLLALPFSPARDNGQLPGRPITLQTCDSSGTPGNATCHKPAGTVSMASTASTVVVANNLVTATSLVFIQPAFDDVGCVDFNVLVGAGSFTIGSAGGAPCADPTKIFWQVITPTP